MFSSILASQVLTGLITGAIVLPLAWLGVRGALRNIVRLIKAVESDILELETRVTRLQKQRGADASIEARQGAKSLKEDAQERLIEPPAPGRPSVIRFLR